LTSAVISTCRMSCGAQRRQLDAVVRQHCPTLARAAAAPGRTESAERAAGRVPLPSTRRVAVEVASAARRLVSQSTRFHRSSAADVALRCRKASHADANQAPHATGRLPGRTRRDVPEPLRATRGPREVVARKARSPFGPAYAIGMRDALAYRDTQVLVQGHEPVPGRRLVKQRALYCDGGGRKMFSDRAEALEAQRELSTAGVMK